jgi:hypothetical protein
MFHGSTTGRLHKSELAVVEGGYLSPFIFEEGVTTTDDGVIEIAVGGFSGEVCLEVFTDSTKDDVLAVMKSDESSVEGRGFSTHSLQRNEIRYYSHKPTITGDILISLLAAMSESE